LVKVCQYKASGLLCIALSDEKAGRIGLERIKDNNKDVFQTPFGLPLSYIHMKDSPVSVEGRQKTISQLSEEGAAIDQFVYPGHVATLIARPKGLLERRGHTEAVIDLLKLAGEPEVGVLCEVQGVNGGMADYDQIREIFSQEDYVIVSIEDIKNAVVEAAR
jgi:3,4-dihydroxy-2-butanone 4-phosphate synthase